MMLTDDHLREGMEQLKGGRHALALEQFTLAADGAESPDERRAAEAFAAQVSLTLGRPYEVIAWAERLRESSATPDEANVLEASAWVALGYGGQALMLLDSVGQVDSVYSDYPESLLHQLRCQAYGLVGEPQAALVEAFTALLTDWSLPEIWRALAVLGGSNDIDVSEAVARIPDDGVLQVLGWLIESPAAGVDQIVEALWQRSPGDMRVLALVTALGNRLSIERALEWSVRLRAAGLAEDCALLGIAADGQRLPTERIRAAAVAASAFQDGRAAILVEGAATTLADDEIEPTLAEILGLATDEVVESFVVAAATTARRSLVLAAALVARGATSQALALSRHASMLATEHGGTLRVALRTELPVSASSLAGLVAELAAGGHHDLATQVEAGL